MFDSCTLAEWIQDWIEMYMDDALAEECDRGFLEAEGVTDLSVLKCADLRDYLTRDDGVALELSNGQRFIIRVTEQ